MDPRSAFSRSLNKIFKSGVRILKAEKTARPLVENDPASGWRHVKSTNDLMTNAYEGCKTLGDVWSRAVNKFGRHSCMGTRDFLSGKETLRDGKLAMQLELGRYQFDTFKGVDNRINSIVSWLQQAGLKKGDHVVIFAETRADWMQTALACFKFGLPVVTVYATLGEQAVLHALKECNCKVVFTTRNLLSKVANALESCSDLHTVVYYRELQRVDGDDGYATQELINQFEGKKLESFDELFVGSQQPKPIEQKPKADDVALIMYTSGTIAVPKGVMLSHRNVIAAISGQGSVIVVSPKDVYIGYLPLAHILEVCVELVVLAGGARVGYSSAQTLFDRAQRIKKGIYKNVTEEVKNLSPLRQELFRICFDHKHSRYEGGHSTVLIDTLIFRPIRKLLGGRLRGILSGGAPLNSETQRFIRTCFSCPVVQGYGLTETAGAGTLAYITDLSVGTVGPPLRSCEIKLSQWSEYSPYNKNPQGEILIHGDNVALGYFKNKEKTDNEFIMIDDKRYFVTGDIGEFTPTGSLKIIDRKKDLIKLAHGEYISLGKVETTLLTNPLLDNICVYGDSERDHLIALVVPNAKNFEKLAHENGISGSFKELCEDGRLTDILAKELTSSVSEKLTRLETPKKLIVCSEPWTPASGLLTEALKLKRPSIEKAYEKKIKEAYAS
ncbi:putative CoA ligase 4 [Aphelenchoides bicaudatus]|nr:putative CoA ligase 4 [Aphelenchoides bicaudatus]